MFEKLIASSADPKKLSLTVKGLLIAVLPLILAVSGLTETEALPFIDALEKLVFYGASLASVVTTLYGLLRKLKLGRWSAEE